METRKNPLGSILLIALVSYVVFLGVFLYLAYDILKGTYSGDALWLRLAAISAVFIVATLSELLLKIKMGYKKSLPYRLVTVTLFLLVLFWVMDYSILSAAISTVLIVTLYYFWDRSKARRMEG